MREKKAVCVCVFVDVCARGTSWALCSLSKRGQEHANREGGEKKRQEGGRKGDTSVPPVSGDKDGVARACNEL